MARKNYRLRIPASISNLVTMRLRVVADLHNVTIADVKRDLQEVLLGYVNLGQLPPDATIVGTDPEFGEIYAFTFGGVQIGICVSPETSEVFILAVDEG